MIQKKIKDSSIALKETYIAKSIGNWKLSRENCEYFHNWIRFLLDRLLKKLRELELILYW